MSKYYFYTFYSDIVTVIDRLTLQKIRDSVIRDLLNKHDIKHWPLPDESFSSKILDLCSLVAVWSASPLPSPCQASRL